MEGSVRGMVKVRLVADDEKAQDLAAILVRALNDNGYSLIEWTVPFPCREPESEKSRVYLTALEKAARERDL